MKAKSVMWGLIVLVTIIWLSAGCQQKTVLTFGKPSVIGVVAVDEDTSAEAAVEVGGSRLLPVVAINNETLYLYSFSSSGEYMWQSYWEKMDLRLNPGSKCILHVYQSDGEASSDSITVPLPPTVTAPTPSFVLQKGNPLAITWAATAGVTQYYLEIYIDYSYYDTAGNYSYFSLDTSLYLSGYVNSITFPAASIFPPEVDEVLSGHGDIYLEVEAGPKLGRESKGNINGNGCGYFWATAYDYAYFGIGTQQLDVSIPHKPTPGEVAKKFLERKKTELGE